MASKKKTVEQQPYVVCRGNISGVTVGYLVSKDVTEIHLREARQVWEWYGPETTSGLARLGPGPRSKIDAAAPMRSLLRVDIASIDTCTPEAAALFAASVWTK